MPIKNRLLTNLKSTYNAMDMAASAHPQKMHPVLHNLEEARALCQQGLTEVNYAKYGEEYDGLIMAVKQILSDRLARLQNGVGRSSQIFQIDLSQNTAKTLKVNLDEVLVELMPCHGLIIDLRGNGGGTLNYAETLAARFATQKTLVGYMQHKTGKGHSDFSDMEPKYLEPSSHLRWHKPVCVLTNRHVFSAANEFALYMHALPNVKLVGDHTGGGAGMPMSNSLPNGWVVRYSAIPMYDAQRKSTEFGIEPDYNVQLTDDDFLRGEDTIIEFARKLLAQ